MPSPCSNQWPLRIVCPTTCFSRAAPANRGSQVAGTVRRACAVAVPTGFSSPGVKANVLFFDAKQARENRGPKNCGSMTCAPNALHAETKPLRRADLDEFVKCFNPENRHQRRQTWSERSRRRCAVSPMTTWPAHKLNLMHILDQGQTLEDPRICRSRTNWPRNRRRTWKRPAQFRRFRMG